jgi:tetrapyrrole methylase family protein/MazG family protein
MNQPGITILGLGPGDPNLLTRQAWSILKQASEIYLRTRQHPGVGGYPPGMQIHSFDHLYQAHDSFETVYDQIVEQILVLGRRPQGVIYGVPGHPFIAEATGPEIYRRAKEAGIPVRIYEGLSFIEPTFTALGIDPFPYTTLVDALSLMALHHPPFPPDAPALIAQIYDVQIAAEVKLTLMNLYPDEHPVKLVHAAGTKQETVEACSLYEIDRSSHIGLTTVLYLPPLGEQTSFEGLQEIAAHLRAPEGCPWDQEQTLQSMRPHLMEEAYEVLDAIDRESPAKVAEELGDLLLVITMLMQIASEEGDFTGAEVLSGISAKLIHRHPHVFGDLKVEGAQAVLQNWERLKADERHARGESGKLLLDGVSIALPALVQAQEYQDRAARVGFDWPEIQGVIEKVSEEITEMQAAVDQGARANELGDLLFALVNLSRWYQVDAESALRGANARFRQRFAYIERAARDQGRDLSAMSLAELDALWEAAKKDQASQGPVD